MDSQVAAVLDLYHERIVEERKLRSEKSPSGQSEDWRDRQLLAVGPETGQLINLIARSMDGPNILEIGTSYGYSGIWLAEAARASGGRVITLELKDYKSTYAHDMAVKAGLAEHIDFKVGDAVDIIESLSISFDFILLDLWKDLYVPCLEAFYPKLNPGAVIVADNILHPGGDAVRRYVAAVRKMPGISSVLLPVGSGIEVSRLEPR